MEWDNLSIIEEEGRASRNTARSPELRVPYSNEYVIFLVLLAIS